MSVPNVPSSGHRQRLRDRFERHGLSAFTEHEVLELLLTLAIPRSDVKGPAKALLTRFGSVKAVLDAPAADLRQVQGIGAVAPTALAIIRESAAYYLGQASPARLKFTHPKQLADIWRLQLSGLQHEEFHVAHLDAQLALLRDGLERLEQGVVNQTAVYPRKVMEAVLKRGSAAIVVAHNHPSGDLKPSEQDKELTRQLLAASQALQIRLLDHLVIAGDGYFSFKENGLL